MSTPENEIEATEVLTADADAVDAADVDVAETDEIDSDVTDDSAADEVPSDEASDDEAAATEVPAGEAPVEEPAEVDPVEELRKQLRRAPGALAGQTHRTRIGKGLQTPYPGKARGQARCRADGRPEIPCHQQAFQLELLLLVPVFRHMRRERAYQPAR